MIISNLLVRPFPENPLVDNTRINTEPDDHPGTRPCRGLPSPYYQQGKVDQARANEPYYCLINYLMWKINYHAQWETIEVDFHDKLSTR